MCLGILAHALALGAEDERDPGRAERFGQGHIRLAGEADPPEAGGGHIVERAGEIDDADPGHGLERPRRRLGERSGFGRGVPVLRDHAQGVERRRGAQDRADIVRIGDLIEDEQRAMILRLIEEVGEEKIFEPLDLDDDALVRRVARDEAAEIGDVGESERDGGVDLVAGGGLARREDPHHPPLRIGERGGDGVSAPETGAVLGLGRLAGLASHRFALAAARMLGKRRRFDILARQGEGRMATIASPAAERMKRDRIFYSSMGLAIAATVLWGFSASFYLSPWLEAPPTTPDMTGLLYLHGAVFTAWIALMVVQPLLIAARNPALHRRLGYLGAGVAAAMVVLGNLAAIAAMHGGFRGLGDPMVFYAVPFFAINSFAVAVFLAVRWRNRAETHKRLILLSNAALLGAAIARIPLGAVQSGAPFTFIFGPDLIILAGALYDWRTRGQVHGVWLWGGGAMILSQIVMMAVMGTAWWHGFASFMARLWA